MYERILELDKRLDVAKKQLQVCEERERKLQREVVKGSKGVGLTQDKLQQAVDAKNLAETECESVSCVCTTKRHTQNTEHREHMRIPRCKGSREHVNYREKHALFCTNLTHVYA